MGYFCENLNNNLTCSPEGIRACCAGNTDTPLYFDTQQMNKKFDLSNLLEKKKSFLNNIETSACKDCFYLRPLQDSDVFTAKYKNLDISHWIQCNCDCIYCTRMDFFKNEKTFRAKRSSYYDMLPLLKNLYKYDLIDRENLTVLFHGGDIAVLKEFPPLIKELYKNGFQSAFILTNNILYQPLIEKLLKDNKGGMTTSLDSGSKETYFKIKRVDKFDSCISNLKKYVSKSENPKIKVKYIIVDNINDNIEEIEKFLKLMSSIGIYYVEFMIDNRYIYQPEIKQGSLPEHYLHLLHFFKEKCQELNLDFFIENITQDAINKSFAI